MLDKDDVDNEKMRKHKERLKLASKLDDELNDFINSLEKKTYTEGWTEETMLKELDSHPFFMKKLPDTEEPLHPLVEGLQQLKYSEEENTPEELALSYKEDGNFHFKNKKYRMSIISYTLGLRTKCSDPILLAALYNNRAAAHYMLKNYRSSLNDSKQAIKLKSDYVKSLERAAHCCFEIKDFDQCDELCDSILEMNPTKKEILKLKTKVLFERSKLEDEARKNRVKETKLAREEEKLLSVIKEKGIKLELLDDGKIPKLQDLEPRVPALMQNKVHLDGNNKLVWPVIFLYPEFQETDFVQNFHEDITIKEQLEELFSSPAEWDVDNLYEPDTVSIYFEGKDVTSLNKVDISHTLGKILKNEQFLVRSGTPAFLVFVKDSKAEAQYLKTLILADRDLDWQSK